MIIFQSSAAINLTSDLGFMSRCFRAVHFLQEDILLDISLYCRSVGRAPKALEYFVL